MLNSIELIDKRIFKESASLIILTIRIMKNGKGLSQSFLYTLVYVIIGIFVGILESAFLTVSVLPLLFLMLMHYAYEDKSNFWENNLGVIFLAVCFVVSAVTISFLGIHGYKNGKRYDKSQTNKKKWLIIALIVEVLILIPALYFFVGIIS